MKRLLIVALLVGVCGCSQKFDYGGPTPIVIAPVIQSFTADATRLGNSFLDTYLRWDVIGDLTTRCRIDPNIGNVPMAGFVQIRPGVSKDFLLQCSNQAGTVVRVVSIIVG